MLTDKTVGNAASKSMSGVRRDTDAAEGSIDRQAKATAESSAETSALANAYKAMAEQSRNTTAGLQSLVDSMREMATSGQRINVVTKSFGAGIAQGAKATTSDIAAMESALDNLIASLDNTNAQIDLQKKKLSELQWSYDLAAKIDPNSSRALKLEEQLLKTEARMVSLTEKSDKTSQKIWAVEDAMEAARKSMKNAERNIDDARKSTKDLGEESKKAAAGIGSLVRAGASLHLLRKGLRLVTSAFKDFTQLDASSRRVGELFGDAAADIDAFASSSLRSLGLAKTSALDYAATYGNLFRDLTRDGKQNAQVTEAMLRSSAVIASKTGRTIEDVNDRIKSGLLGNTRAIRELGLNVNVSSLEMSKAFRQVADGRSWQQLNEYEQQQIRTLAILEQAHAKYGTEVAQTSGLASATLGGAMRDLSASFGELFAFGLTPLIQGLAQLVAWVGGAVQAINNANTPAKVLLTISMMLAVSIPIVTLATKGLAVAKTMLAKATAVATAKQLTFAAALKASLGWISLVAGAVGLLFAVFGGAGKEQDRANNVIDATADVADTAADAVDNLGKGIQGLGKAAKGLAGFDEINTLAGGKGGGAINNLLGSFDPSIFDDIAKGFEDIEINHTSLADSISKRWENIKKNMKKAFDDEDNPIIGVAAAGNEFVRGTFGDDWTDFWEDVGARMHTQMADNWDNVKKAGTFTWGFVKDRWESFWTHFKAGTMNEWVDENWEILKKVNKVSWNFIKDKWNIFWDKFKDTKAGKKVSETWALVKAGANLTWTFIKTKWNSFWDKFKDTKAVKWVNDSWQQTKANNKWAWSFIKTKWTSFWGAFKKGEAKKWINAEFDNAKRAPKCHLAL